MSAFSEIGPHERVRWLRAEFDGAFAAAPPPPAAATEDLLAIRLAGRPHALRLREVFGLVLAHKIVRLPSRAPHLLGVAGLRGGVVTVFSLETLLGLSATETPSFWLALAGGRDAFAFAFPVLDGFLRAPRAEVVKDGEDPAHNAAARTREYVSTGSLLRPIVDVDAMRETVNAHAGSTGNDRER
jgi:chemotaxis signal transduction protein